MDGRRGATSLKCRTMRKGIAVSPGIAVVTAYVITEIYVGGKTTKITSDEIQSELNRFEAARQRTAMDLQHLEKKVATQVMVDTVRDALDERLGPLLPALRALLAERGIDLDDLGQAGGTGQGGPA